MGGAAPLSSPQQLRFPPGVRFLSRCAARIVDALAARLPDLSGARVVVPSLLLAPALRRALGAAAGGPVLLPPVLTLASWADTRLAGHWPEPASRRQFALYAALKSQRWLEGSDPWQLSDELMGLFDELDEAAVALPGEGEALEARLAAGYGMAPGGSLGFEARLVHELWRLDGMGAPSQVRAHRLALEEIAAAAPGPLFFVADEPPRGAAADFLARYAAREPVEVFLPDRFLAEEPEMRLLAAAWPAPGDAASAPPLRLRAEALRGAAGLGGRVVLYGAGSLEHAAAWSAELVRRWLAQGCERVALVAVDRVTARRSRALLERDGILVEDETGWKLATTRAAALVDAWLETVAADAYHRDLLDLLKSPFAFTDEAPARRRRAVVQLEDVLARHNLAAGLGAMLQVLREEGRCADALALLERVQAAAARWPTAAAPVALWLERLEGALATLGAVVPLEADAAGRQLLALLRLRREELAGTRERLGFPEFRAWLDRQLEAALFRDTAIRSPVVMTHLAAARLRSFDAAVVVGADREQLAAAARGGIFGHDGVRRELGLPGREALAARLREDLAGLIAGSGQTAFVWQTLKGAEPNLLAADLELLSLTHELACGDGLLRHVPHFECAADPVLKPLPRPAPPCPADRLPPVVSPSSYGSLVACPYQFFVRYVLGLGEREAVSEALEKRDYGERVHGILARFHARFPRVTGEDEGRLLAALEEESRAAFAGEVARNFLEHAWLERWLRHLPAYLAWQRGREAAGWAYGEAEAVRRRELAMADGAPLALQGRIDRMDRRSDGPEAVLDYKTQGLGPLRSRVADPDADVQLAVYALLQGSGVAEAAYVALDDERVAAIPLEDPAALAALHGERLRRSFQALRAGAPMPAHGDPVACGYCEARGLCRRDFQA